MKKHFFILCIIVILGVILRFYQLGEVPSSINRDEAFLGYNAYSLLKTAKDMHGVFLPLHLASFLYSPAGYSYFSIPFIAFFELNTFSVRFASALFGSLSIVTMYFLVKRIFQSHRSTQAISFISAFLLAISPWHINLSRTAAESTTVVFFTLLGVLLFLIWKQKQKFYLLVLPFISFGVTILTYQAPRAFLPLFIPLLFFIFLYYDKKFKKNTLFPIIFFILTILLPLILILSSPDLSLRIRTVSVFNNIHTQLVVNEQLREDGVYAIWPLLARVFHNKVGGYTQVFLENYFSHFSFPFLFTEAGYPDRYRVPLMGLLYLFELPFLIFGAWFLLHAYKRIGIFLVLWILIVPIGSALTSDDVPNLQRTLLMLPAIVIFTALGIYYVFLILRERRKIFIIVFSGLAVVVIYSVSYYLHQYYVHLDKYRSWYRHSGYSHLVREVNSLLPNYKKAIITNHESAPAIFFLFYSKYDPAMFQQEVNDGTMKNLDMANFNNYEFSEEACPLREEKEGNIRGITGEKGIVYVNSGTCKSLPKEAKLLKEIYRRDNSKVFEIVTVN